MTDSQPMRNAIRPRLLMALAVVAALLALPATASAAGGVPRVSVIPKVVTPDGDKVNDIAILRVRLRRTSTVATTIFHGRRRVARLRTVRMRPGLRSIRWNPRTRGGTAVAAGTYRVKMLVREPRGRWRFIYTNVRVAAPRPAPVMPTGDTPLQWPVAGTVESTFGMRGGRMHDGIDIIASTGTAIGAAAAGTVRSTGWIDGYGLTVVVDHADGTSTLYAHLSRMGVRAGRVVAAGDTIGYVGSTGNTTTAHLHFELRDGSDRPIDPMPSLPPLP